jgi:hypothetical protein
MYTPHSDTVRPVPMNKRLWDASIGNWWGGRSGVDRARLRA